MADTNFADKTIWTGDNLDILRGLNSDCVDLVYLDPPFNSNRAYAAPVGSKAAGAAFKDTWTLSDLDVAWLGLIADQHPALYQLLMAAGLTHGKGMQSYLTMMAVRLLELHRVLKPTGSLYLHCDDTASAYLKVLLDAVFGQQGFRNEITWERTRGRSDGKHWGNTTDTILFYVKSGAYAWRNVYRERPTEADATLGDLTAAELRNGISGASWGGYNPTERGRHWAVPRSNRLAEWIDANRIPGYLRIKNPHDRLDALNAAGMISWSDNGRPAIIRPAEVSRGAKVNNLWHDITRAASSERTGYPTQKPLALLERIIAASSNPGDLVLDPFCGCATTLIAAEKLGRQWAGIDLSEKAVGLVKLRLAELPASLRADRQDVAGLVTARTDIPRRTDIGQVPPYRQQKHVLFGQQEGRCAGCGVSFDFRHLEVDHILARSRGGTDHEANLQLLCGSCNRLKGNRSQEHLVVRLQELGIR